jgi:hypothetical protein
MSTEPTYELPTFEWQAPPAIDWTNSHGVGDLGASLVTYVYGLVGGYLLEFWQYVLPFFIALALFWVVLNRLLGQVQRLDDEADWRDDILRRQLSMDNAEAARRGIYSRW